MPRSPVAIVFRRSRSTLTSYAKVEHVDLDALADKRGQEACRFFGTSVTLPPRTNSRPNGVQRGAYGRGGGVGRGRRGGRGLGVTRGVAVGVPVGLGVTLPIGVGVAVGVGGTVGVGVTDGFGVGVGVTVGVTVGVGGGVPVGTLKAYILLSAPK